MHDEYRATHADFLVRRGDIVIALSGATTGKYGIYRSDDIALLNQRVGRIRYYGDSLISSRYVFHYLSIIRQEVLNRAYGAAQPNISTRELAQFAIPLPPSAEQRRIVAKIEELFTRLDAGIESLKKVQAQLKQYRQSVLKAAVEGKLTEEWRAAHKDELEPASVLHHMLYSEL
ncbi:restriction endonuclease subunit S, partial [Candidatus Poribacteria bacterium]